MRCRAVVIERGEERQCFRRRANGDLCDQHAAIEDRERFVPRWQGPRSTCVFTHCNVCACPLPEDDDMGMCERCAEEYRGDCD